MYALMPYGARCSNHRLVETNPHCHTCKRIGTEIRIVKRTVDALIKAGYWLNVDNGGDTEELDEPTQDREALHKVLGETDDERIMVYRAVDGPLCAWVLLVYGNDGWDVISDYTTNIDPIIEPIIDSEGE